MISENRKPYVLRVITWGLRRLHVFICSACGSVVCELARDQHASWHRERDHGPR